MKKQKVFFDVIRLTSAMTTHHIIAYEDFDAAKRFVKNEIKYRHKKDYKKINDTSWGIEDVYGLLEGWIIMKREIL